MSPSPILANLSPRATVLSPDRGRVVTFDREGRWLYYFRRGKTFKRSLASEVHLRFRQQGRQRRRLEKSEALALFSEVYELAQDLVAWSVGEVQQRLHNEVLRWTPERLAGEAVRFAAAYRPIAILPPDQYLSVVLQATEGCTWNACTFCNFYMDRPLRVHGAGGFREHADRVKLLLGEGLRLRRGIFLGDGNALALSNDRLDPLLEVARDTFPGRDLFGFVDLYSGDRRSADEWAHLADKGLRRVYVGMETGLDELLQWVDKPGSARDLRQFVETLKAVGMQVSLIVIVGLGGREYRLAHREATRDLLFGLPLDRQDLVYLSPFVEHDDGAYRERRVAAGLTPMDEPEVESELAHLATELRGRGLRASRYDIREFVY